MQGKDEYPFQKQAAPAETGEQAISSFNVHEDASHYDRHGDSMTAASKLEPGRAWPACISREPAARATAG